MWVNFLDSRHLCRFPILSAIFPYLLDFLFVLSYPFSLRLLFKCLDCCHFPVISPYDLIVDDLVVVWTVLGSVVWMNWIHLWVATISVWRLFLWVNCNENQKLVKKIDLNTLSGRETKKNESKSNFPINQQQKHLLTKNSAQPSVKCGLVSSKWSEWFVCILTDLAIDTDFIIARLKYNVAEESLQQYDKENKQMSVNSTKYH